MGKCVLIVESPAKAKTIEKFLGKGYSVEASMGHVRDLPRSQFGVDVDDNFTPKYITIRGKGEIIKRLREAVKKADKVYLAADPDREGEAIAWHLAYLLGLNPSSPCRVEFNEITKQAVRESLKHPRPIDQNRVDAQQARRVLDRLVGYNLSPLLWDKVKRGLSAGRVQSVAVKLICDRQREIDAFKPEEYWTVTVHLAKETKEEFPARLVGRGADKLEIKDEASARALVEELQEQEIIVLDVTRRERRKNPHPPFTTSTLQQEAARKLGFTVKKTMSLAQQLYEGLEVGKEGRVGLITYMRTDSTRISPVARQEALDYIERTYGPEYKGAGAFAAARSKIQDAHEGIRPTQVNRLPQDVAPYLTRDQLRLYTLIWERFVASQMAPAVYDQITVDIAAGELRLKATGSQIKFRGYTAVYEESRETDDEDKELALPPLHPGEKLTLVKTVPEQHFTQPPPAYTEASLVKTLEEKGIGRPSTYAPTVETIIKRGYVTREQKKLKPTELGYLVTDLLREYFPEIIDEKFTAEMEDKLDQIEEGKAEWRQVVGEFYPAFANQVQQAREKMQEVRVEEEVSDEVCELCGRRMVIKEGRFGKFLACPGFPDCRNTKPLREGTGIQCPLCGGEILVKISRRGRRFYGCENYPACKFVTWDPPTEKRCPRCGSLLVRKESRRHAPYLACSNKECGYTEKTDDVKQGEEERQKKVGS
ncbi:MAG: topoisomerase [Bacillota bacterium]|jgi:DNA topoisomerase-1|nr:topoisomerase [Bacillota bacterium]MDK2882722.1 topoisomerase [Bacillota bacterium]MDK2960784.1 topoisomerase [Bacillota bacterium]